MRGFSNQGLEGIGRTDADKDAMELQCGWQPWGHVFHVLPSYLCRASKKLGWIHREEASPCAHTQCSCKGWCKLPMSKGSCLFVFNGGFLSPSEADFFSWTLWGSPRSVLLSGKLCLNDVTEMGKTKESTAQRVVFSQAEKIVASGGTLLWMLLNLYFYIPKASKTSSPFPSLTMLYLSEGCCCKHFLRWRHEEGRGPQIPSKCLSHFWLDMAFWACLPSAVPGVHRMLSG